MINKNLSFSLPVVITKQGKRFVAYTPALDISTSGKTEKEVKVRFTELAHLFLEEVFEAKTANTVLAELGWKKVQKTWTPPEVVSSQKIGFKMAALA